MHGHFPIPGERAPGPAPHSTPMGTLILAFLPIEQILPPSFFYLNQPPSVTFPLHRVSHHFTKLSFASSCFRMTETNPNLCQQNCNFWLPFEQGRPSP